MPGAIPPLLLAEVLLIMAWKLLVFLAPLLAAFALWRLIDETDRIINYFFPDLEWEHSLGWLNIKAERRANMVLRWLGYGVCLFMAALLPGIVWATRGLADELADWPDPQVIGDVMLEGAVLFACAGLWVFYLGAWLLPKIRREREEAGLRRFRAEMKVREEEIEAARQRQPVSRVKVSLQKPRVNTPMETFFTDRAGRRRQPPGG